MERPRPLHPAAVLPEHLRRRVRLHAPRAEPGAPGPRAVPGPRLQPEEEVPTDRAGGQLAKAGALGSNSHGEAPRFPDDRCFGNAGFLKSRTGVTVKFSVVQFPAQFIKDPLEYCRLFYECIAELTYIRNICGFYKLDSYLDSTFQESTLHSVFIRT